MKNLPLQPPHVFLASGEQRPVIGWPGMWSYFIQASELNNHQTDEHNITVVEIRISHVCILTLAYTTELRSRNSHFRPLVSAFIPAWLSARQTRSRARLNDETASIHRVSPPRCGSTFNSWLYPFTNIDVQMQATIHDISKKRGNYTLECRFMSLKVAFCRLTATSEVTMTSNDAQLLTMTFQKPRKMSSNVIEGHPESRNVIESHPSLYLFNNAVIESHPTREILPDLTINHQLIELSTPYDL